MQSVYRRVKHSDSCVDADRCSTDLECPGSNPRPLCDSTIARTVKMIESNDRTRSRFTEGLNIATTVLLQVAVALTLNASPEITLFVQRDISH